MRRVPFCLLGLVLAMSLSAPGARAEGPKLRIGIHRALQGSIEVIAHKKGYWKEAGLDYSVKYFKQGKLMRNAIIQDNLDTGTTGFSPFVIAISKGAKVKGIAVTAKICSIFRFFVPKNSKLTLKDLKGKVVANSKGTSTDFAFHAYILPAFGLKSEDVRILNVKTTDRIAALVAGNADVAIVGDPQGEIALRKGMVRPIGDFCPYDDTAMMHIGNPLTVSKHPELYEKYFQGWLRSLKLLKENPEEYARVYTEALKEVGDKAEYKIVLSVVKRLKPSPEITQKVRTYLNDMAEKQMKLHWIKKHPDFTKSDILDDSIYRKVAKEMHAN